MGIVLIAAVIVHLLAVAALVASVMEEPGEPTSTGEEETHL